MSKSGQKGVRGVIVLHPRVNQGRKGCQERSECCIQEWGRVNQGRKRFIGEIVMHPRVNQGRVDSQQGSKFCFKVSEIICNYHILPN